MIGCGTVACYGHLPALASLNDVIELVAVADLNADRLAELKDKYNLDATYTDYRELLDRDDIEAIGMAVPLPGHHQVVIDAAAAGKHVFGEKPIAPTVEQGAEMVEAMDRAGKLFAINFEMRHSDPHPEMKRLLDSGAIGELKVARFVGNWMGGRWAGAERYRMLITEGLGPIVDCGIHYFDLARWYTGSEYAEVNARGTYIEDYPNPDHVIATCRMENGVMVLNENGWAYTHNTPAHGANLHYELIGTDGMISYQNWQCSIEGEGDRKELSVYTKGECYRKAVNAPAKAFDTMYRLFAEGIRKGELIGLPSGHDGVQALGAALEALRQAKGE
jgi:predicted dehydrogenase